MRSAEEPSQADRKNSRAFSGFLAFSIVWAGQFISVLATQMSSFAITIWAYEKTGSATALGLTQVFFSTPFLLFSPLAGAMVDRYNRKLMMMVSDLISGTATIGLLVLHINGQLEIWHIYLAAALQGFGNCFQWPAYSAAISLMVPKRHLGRANGMMSLVEMGPGIVAPLLAGALLPIIGFAGILTIDTVTFLLAIAMLAAVSIPQPTRTQVDDVAKRGGLIQEAMYGFRYLWERPSLFGLQMIPLFGNLFWGIAFTLLAPMILSRTSNDESVYGFVQSVAAVGGVIGGVLMSIWGGFQRRIHGILVGWIWVGITGMLLGLSREPMGWAVFAFLGALPFALMSGSSQAIYQTKVAPDVQGRVFAARRLLAFLTNPLSPIIAGVLADRVLEPAFRAGGTPLTTTLGNLVGAGPGSGMALLMTLCGFMMLVVGITGYVVPLIHNVETTLPDQISPDEPAR